MGCGLLSGGLVRAVRYARDVCGSLCQRSAHMLIAAALFSSFCFLIVWGLSMVVGSAVQVASRASCLALLNPMNGAAFSSQLSLISISG